MDDTQVQITNTALRIFEKHATPQLLASRIDGPERRALWDAIEESALHYMMLGEEQGGFGLSADFTLSIIRHAGWFALPIPFADTLVASWIAGLSDLTLPAGAVTLAIAADGAIAREGSSWRIRAQAHGVAWGRSVPTVLIAGTAQPMVAVLAPEQAQCREYANIAGNPSDDLSWEVVVAESNAAPLHSSLSPLACKGLGAAARAAQIAGAAERVCMETAEYVNQRVQFGKPLAKFQAVQHSLAQMASNAAACAAAVDIAARAFDLKPDSWTAAAVAKARASESVATVAQFAHQLHGAIGFTEEHLLHRLTKQLWAWRDEFGGETEWARRYGHELLAGGAEQLWPALTH